MNKWQFTINSATLIGFAFGIITCVTMVQSGISAGKCSVLAVICFIAAAFFVRRVKSA